MSSIAARFPSSYSYSATCVPLYKSSAREHHDFWRTNTSKDSVTGFVRSLSQPELEAAFGGLPTPLIIDRPVLDAASGPINFHGLGSAYHAAFGDHVHRKWIPRELYPFVRTLRSALADIGVNRIYTEWSHRRLNQSWRGAVDASLRGGPQPFGALELKVVGHEPGMGFPDDLCQLGCYCRLAAESGRPISQQYAALAYIMPRHRAVRLLVWTTVAPLVTPLRSLAA